MMSLRTLTAFIVLAAATWLGTAQVAQAAPVQLTGTQLTGTQLAAALLPSSAFFPEGGDKLDKAATTNSGSRIEHAGKRYNLATISCAGLFNDVGYPGFGESAMAASAYLLSGLNFSYWQSVYQFTSPAGADSFYTATHTAWLRCPSFRDLGDTYAVHVKPAGNASYELVMTSHLAEGTAGIAVLTTWTGTDVYLLEAVNIPPESYGQVLSGYMRQLITRVQDAS
jgi:hypothetical protein